MAKAPRIPHRSRVRTKKRLIEFAKQHDLTPVDIADMLPKRHVTSVRAWLKPYGSVPISAVCDDLNDLMDCFVGDVKPQRSNTPEQGELDFAPPINKPAVDTLPTAAELPILLEGYRKRIIKSQSDEALYLLNHYRHLAMTRGGNTNASS
jgi:hypothetical protein